MKRIMVMVLFLVMAVAAAQAAPPAAAKGLAFWKALSSAEKAAFVAGYAEAAQVACDAQTEMVGFLYVCYHRDERHAFSKVAREVDALYSVAGNRGSEVAWVIFKAYMVLAGQRGLSDCLEACDTAACHERCYAKHPPK